MRRFAGPVALLAAVLLLIHAVLSFTKMRWVTGLAEVLATAVILGQWWMLRDSGVVVSERMTSPTTPRL